MPLPGGCRPDAERRGEKMEGMPERKKRRRKQPQPSPAVRPSSLLQQKRGERRKPER